MINWPWNSERFMSNMLAGSRTNEKIIEWMRFHLTPSLCTNVSYTYTAWNSIMKSGKEFVCARLECFYTYLFYTDQGIKRHEMVKKTTWHSIIANTQSKVHKFLYIYLSVCACYFPWELRKSFGVVRMLQTCPIGKSML